MRKLHKKIRGFTLIELLITLFIGSILLAWGIPNYRDFKVRKDVSMSVNEVTYSMNLAKAEAIRYGQDVKVKMTGSSWAEGWEIWTLNETGTENILIFVQNPLSKIDMTQSGGVDGEVIFNRIGGLSTGVGVTFEAESSSNAEVSQSKRNIMILPNGSARIIKP